jgi:hypothetical protein
MVSSRLDAPVCGEADVLQNVTPAGITGRRLFARNVKNGSRRENHAKKIFNEFFGPVAESCPEHAGNPTIVNSACDFGAMRGRLRGS